MLHITCKTLRVSVFCKELLYSTVQLNAQMQRARWVLILQRVAIWWVDTREGKEPVICRIPNYTCATENHLRDNRHTQQFPRSPLASL